MNNTFEKTYKDILKKVLSEGIESQNRTGENTIKLFAQALNINLSEGFPIVTGKKIFFDKALAEFLWIYNGLTDIKFLNNNNIFWWDKYAVDGIVNKSYGYQLRSYGGCFDQIDYVISEIKKGSRRAVVSFWNPLDLDVQNLPCCYIDAVFFRENNRLNCSITFRSSDLFLGLPYDIIFGALLLNEICKKTYLEPFKLAVNLVDAHIYKAHKLAAKKYLKAEIFELPKLNYSKKYYLENYICGPYIKATLF
jgi:thymidylate synthase